MEEETLLLRQVHPSFIQGDQVSSLVFSSQTFKPFPKDHGCLSVYNGDKFTPFDSFEHFTNQKYESSGVVAVTKLECNTIELPVEEDNDPFDGHCFIDYRNETSGQIKKKASKLKREASKRGWLYRI
jgi:hypothetical protein